MSAVRPAGEALAAKAAAALVPMRWWHIPAVMVLERELFEDEAWTQELFWSELASPLTHYLVAYADPAAADLVGYAGLSVPDRDAYIQTIGVTGAAQRRGLGRQLMVALLAEAQRRRALACWLEVRADNDAAQTLYRKLGFVDRGLRKGYYQPSGTDALVMSATLPPRPDGSA